ncbi:MAG: hypothetical protein CM15mP120_09810 [Pseudomonadota bacterium]|nr:MAG: hypothetical protein CM15mP120_09810 [Pseudomonadota bacterium]
MCFLHPTTFGGTASWVAPVDDAQVNAGTDYGSISTQASAFNGCCRIYAPRFRQANILTYSDRQDSTFTQVMHVAYGDIAEAFKTPSSRRSAQIDPSSWPVTVKAPFILYACCKKRWMARLWLSGLSLFTPSVIA